MKAQMLSKSSRLRRLYTFVHSNVFLISYSLSACLLTYIFISLFATRGEILTWTRWIEEALIANLILLVGLSGLLIWRILRQLFWNPAQQSAHRLYVRFVAWFSLAALLPAVIVGVFLSLIFTQALDYWFRDTVKTALNNAEAVAEGYVEETIQDIRAELRAMAVDMDRESNLLLQNRTAYETFLADQAAYRRFASAYILKADTQIMARAESPKAPPYEQPSQEAFKLAQEGKMYVKASQGDDFIRVMIRLAGYDDAYLYVVRFVKPGLLGYLQSARLATSDYDKATQKQDKLRNLTLLIYGEAVFMILLGAVGLGFTAASRVAEPVQRLAKATEEVRGGNLSARVQVHHERDELDELSSAFNRMTQRLQNQQEALILSRSVAENRRSFIEAVLSGVRAGVIGLDSKARITLMNHSAERLLTLDATEVYGKTWSEVIPEFSPILEHLHQKMKPGPNGEITLTRGGRKLTLHVRVAADMHGQNEVGHVVTFDDVSKLAAAQRVAAWRDVARRIAHEIKNPLTPIQLAAERLRRKYTSQITEDPETFLRCTETIIRQVHDIGRMVDEFSSFARMPSPKIAETDLNALIEEVFFAQRLACPDIDFTLEGGDVLKLACDERMIVQALSNVIKNSAESVMEKYAKGEGTSKGHIILRFYRQKNRHRDEAVLEIEDNGPGWPGEDLDSFLEPYVTTRQKGTGLGLAIVKRILEDHHASLELAQSSHYETGAMVRMSLPLLSAGEEKTNPALSSGGQGNQQAGSQHGASDYGT